MTEQNDKKAQFASKLSTISEDKAGALFDQLATRGVAANHLIDSVIAGNVTLQSGSKDFARSGNGTPALVVYYADKKEAENVAKSLVDLYVRSNFDRISLDPQAKRPIAVANASALLEHAY